MKLGLGTVQFGMDYGVSNSKGITPVEEVAKILTIAKNYNIRIIDTASMYGNCEDVLGQTIPNENDFNIITKTPRFDGIELSQKTEFLEQTFRKSLNKLKCSSVYGLLIHNADDLLRHGGELLNRKMQQLKAQHLVKNIGVSVYEGKQIDGILERFDIDLIQLPLNVLDQRLLHSGHLAKLKNAGIEIHARSVFLQGLLLVSPAELHACFDSVKKHLVSYHDTIRRYGLTPVQAALSFVAGVNNIDVVICGVNNHSQLDEICESIRVVEIEKFSKFAIMDEEIINPSKWVN